MIFLWNLYFSVIAMMLYLIHTKAVKLDLIAYTHNGPVRGTVRYAIGRDRPVYSFFGIPYARTPDYTFRFRPPVNPWNWTEVRNMTKEEIPFCYQDRDYLRRVVHNTIYQAYIDENHPITEDCLNLNVFTPQKPYESTNKFLPVIVWFHGGSLQITASTHKMWVLPAFEDVVLVTVQYRLGVFGFLSFDDVWSPPNAGLYDQSKSLQWIKDNIKAFGGNPNSVTIFGLSAGGVSASSHSVSPVSKRLFHRMIAGSGVFNIPTIWEENQQEQAHKIASKLGCKFYEVAFTSTCLRNKASSSAVINASKDVNAMFWLKEDGIFFTDQTDKLVKKHLDSSIPIMIGVVAGEMDYVLLRKFIPEKYFGPVLDRKSAEKEILKCLRKYYPLIARFPKAVEEISSLYLKNASTWKELLRGISDFFADAFFNLKAIDFANSAMEKGTQVYFYHFTIKPSFYENTVIRLERFADFHRADHADDQPFYFGFPFLPDASKRGLTFTKEEKTLSRKLMKTLATFARTGHPVFDDSFQWPEYPFFLDISNKSTIKNNFRFEYINVWNKLLSKIQ